MQPLWKTLLVVLVSGGAIGLLACAGSQTAATHGSSSAEPDALVAKSATPFDSAMHMRFTHHTALRMRDALVAGDLPGVRRAAEQLGKELAEDSFPEHLLPYRAQLAEAAERVVYAGNTAQSATAVAQVAKECGDCHWYARRGPQHFRVDVKLPTRGDEALGGRMLRHGVAAEQFWLGLVGPSEDMWMQGGKTMASAPFAPPTVDEDLPRGEQLAADAEALRDVAKAARLADSFEDRAQVYGDFLAACANCHRAAPR